MTDERKITSGEFADLVARMRIKHIEEVEKRTGRPLDEVMDIPEVGIRAHAIAYIVAVDRDPAATWDDAGDAQTMTLVGDPEGEAPAPAVPTELDREGPWPGSPPSEERP